MSFLRRMSSGRRGDPYPVLKMTEKGKKYSLWQGANYCLEKEETKAKTLAKGDIAGYDTALFEILRSARKGLPKRSRCLHLLYFLTRPSMRCADTIPQCLLK